MRIRKQVAWVVLAGCAIGLALDMAQGAKPAVNPAVRKAVAAAVANKVAEKKAETTKKTESARGLTPPARQATSVHPVSTTKKAAIADNGKTAQKVDELLAEEVFAPASSSSSPVQLAPKTDDEVFLRRAYLDLIGELPMPSDITVFVLDPSADKREKVVERLLSDARFGMNWARYWRDVILYRRVEDRALITSRGVENFLTEKLNANAGWDQIAQALIEAKGNIAEAGETALIMAQMADANDVASEVSRIFLGVQIQCAQCHDHPTDRWKRQQFHEFAAFFPRISARPVFSEGRVRGFEVVSVDREPRFRMANVAGRGSLEHYMPDLKDPSSQGKLMKPVFFATGQKLETGMTDQERRGTIGDWITSPKNEWFAKAFVNRVWAELVGEGFYEPVDDMGPDRSCSAPKTLDYLAKEFVWRSYDIKWLYRTILATDAYQRESRPRRNEEQTPFTANCTQRLRGDQIFDLLVTALGANPQAMGGTFRPANYPGLQFGGRFQFNQSFGFDPSIRRDEVTGSIPQALSIMNSSLVNQAINGRSTSTVLGKLLADTKDDEEVAVELYLRCLAREPNKQELVACVDHVRDTGDRAAAFEDILWALVNRTEFLYRN